MHGVGRLCRVTGQIYEGYFHEGVQHKFGRDIDYHTNYTGKWNMGKKLDSTAIEWSSGTNDSYFDQSMLQAKKEMIINLKTDIMDRIMVVKSSHGQRKRKNRKVKTKKESNPVKDSGLEQIRKSQITSKQNATELSLEQELLSPDAESPLDESPEVESPSCDETPTPGVP